MSYVSIVYKEYSPFERISELIKSDANKLLNKQLASKLENEINLYAAENEGTTITAVLGYGSESGGDDDMVCLDLKDGGTVMKSWSLGEMKTYDEEES